MERYVRGDIGISLVLREVLVKHKERRSFSKKASTRRGTQGYVDQVHRPGAGHHQSVDEKDHSGLRTVLLWEGGESNGVTTTVLYEGSTSGGPYQCRPRDEVGQSGSPPGA